MNLEESLPAELRRPSTTITRIAAGLSGAGVYRVEADGQVLVLKVSGEEEPFADWSRKLQIRQLAADAGVAPRVIHVNEERRAVLSAFAGDGSFPAFYRDPRTHQAALEELGRMLRRVHELPLPAQRDAIGPAETLASVWVGPLAAFTVPAFVRDAIEGILAEEAPAHEALVLSHNDVNPTNLAYDGERVLLLDWETAGPNGRFYDLAAISVFLRMDETTCRSLLAAYEGEPVSMLPGRFTYTRRLVAVLCGAILLDVARKSGHAGASGLETLDATPSLGDFYKRLGAGEIVLGTAEVQWWFGLALIKESVALGGIL